jgi:hypothetical protein
LRRRGQLSVNDQHRSAVDDGSHEAPHQYRVVSTDVSGALLLDQRIDQHLEGRPGLGNEVIIFCGRLDESAEHHPVEGWMRDWDTRDRRVRRRAA